MFVDICLENDLAILVGSVDTMEFMITSFACVTLGENHNGMEDTAAEKPDCSREKQLVNASSVMLWTI